MSALVKYDAARYALSQAVQIDEVKDIRDKAQAMAAYARQAKDTELVEWATEIKVRAERKAGQMLAEMPMNKGAAATRSHDVTALPAKLEDIGISKNESSRWQKLAAVTDDQFESAVAAAKEVAGEVTTAAMLRAAKNTTPSADDGGTVAGPVELRTPPAAKTDIPKVTAIEDGELEALREELAELKASMKETLADNEMMGRVFDADDRIAAAMAEAKRQKAIADNAERTLAAKNGEYIERARAVTMWQNRCKKLEKELAKAAA